MADAKRDFARYLAQRLEVGERELITEDGVEVKMSGVPSKASDKPSPVPLAEEKAIPKWLDGAPEIPAAGITIEAPETHLFVADPLQDLDLEGIGELVRSCKLCALCEGRNKAVPGEGPQDAKLLVIGEGPGATEDETGRPFVGRAGKLLDDILTAIDCPREKVFIGNVVKCRPPKNRDPEATEIEQCLPYLNRQIALIHPSVILAMGRTAASTLLNTRGSLGSLRNKVHTYRGIPLVVTYHPAALLRNPHWKKPTWDDVRIARRILAGEQ